VPKKKAHQNALGGPGLGKKPTAQTIPQPQPTTHQPRLSGGPVPAWKLQQIEKERRDQERIAEEEKKRKEKMYQTSGVVEESVVTLGGLSPQYQNLESKSQTFNEGGAEIDSTSVAKEADYETQLKLEEERIMKKTINTAPMAAVTAKQTEPNRSTSQNFGKKIKVTWIERGTDRPIATHDWYCNQDRLPQKAIMHEWQIKNLVWADLEQPIELQPDGFSDVTFTGISQLKIYADPV